jgi:hypothetical protein
MCAYAFKPEKPIEETLVYSERVQKLQKEYDSYGLVYIVTPDDERERIFYEWVKNKPETYKKSVYAIYRVATKEQPRKEYYYYRTWETVMQDNNIPRPPFESTIGVHMKPIITIEQSKDESGKPVSVKKAAKHVNVWELEWNPKEVKTLLDSSFTRCESFYVGIASPHPEERIEGNPYTIHNVEDFLNGKFDDLMDLCKLGVSFDEPSLYLLDRARKKARENKEKFVGMREPRAYA